MSLIHNHLPLTNKQWPRLWKFLKCWDTLCVCSKCNKNQIVLYFEYSWLIALYMKVVRLVFMSEGHSRGSRPDIWQLSCHVHPVARSKCLRTLDEMINLVHDSFHTMSTHPEARSFMPESHSKRQYRHNIWQLSWHVHPGFDVWEPY